MAPTRFARRSEGDFTEMTPHKDVKRGAKDVDESTDSYDTIAWLIANVTPNNGRVGIWGGSYPGFYTTASCIDPHPALKACSPQAPMTDLWRGDDLFHNGAFYLGANFSFYQGFGRTPRAAELGPDPRYPAPAMNGDAYKFLLELGPIATGARQWLKPGTAPHWEEVMAHPSYDAFWQARDIGRHLNKVAPAMLVVGGFYDAEDLAGPWNTWRAIEARANRNGGVQNTLVMGPWSHGGWGRGDGTSHGTLQWATKTGPFYRDSIEFPFFMHHLTGGASPALPKVLIFRSGAERWDRYDSFPAKGSQPRALVLQAGGALALMMPGAAPQRDASAGAFTAYESDPANPVPVVGRRDGSGMPRDYMTGDQRFASQRPDVITFQSAPLDRDVTISGPVSPFGRTSMGPS